MISFKPRSILQLTITGFVVVAGILITTLIIMARQFDDFSNESQRMINDSAEAMGAIGTLLEQASAMERNARQYAILGDSGILDVYSERRRTFSSSAEQLNQLGLGVEMSNLLQELVSREKLAFDSLEANEGNVSVAYFPELIDGADQASDLVREWINSELNIIQQETEETKQLLRLQSGLLVGIALVLAALFTVLITSPLLQTEKAINRLGSGIYDKPVIIKGPKDLSDLGEQLDWLRNRLSTLEQHRTSFLRHVSHELKTPLASMQESAFLLRDGVVGGLTKEQKEIIQILSSNCERLQGLIDNLLRYNRDSFSVLNAMPEQVKLDKVIENVIKAHTLTIKNRKLHVKKNLEKVLFKGNAEQLRVVIDNLFTNALKFSPEHGEIELYLRRSEAMIEIDVIDQGPGILESEHAKIFDAFYQGTDNNDRDKKSSGLGLTIAMEYIQSNGGTIELVPRTAGAHFKVSLPVDREITRSS